MRFVVVFLLALACSEQATSSTDGPPDGASDAGAPSGYLLDVNPGQVAARQHLGGPGEQPLALTFHVPSTLGGGGLPASLTGATDLAIAEIELPQALGSTDENAPGSQGLLSFDGPRFCMLGAPCPDAALDGYWSATVRTLDGSTREVQLGLSEMDQTPYRGVPYYRQTFGVFLATGDRIDQGEELILTYQGKMTGRATDWSDLPFIIHFRYRSFDAGGQPEPWTTLTDEQVQPLQITAAATAKFVRALAPMDVEAGAPFSVALVITDHYGNPKPFTGSVMLSGGVQATVVFDNEWRKEVPGITYAMPGLYKIVPTLAGARSIYHYTRAWDGPPPFQRLFGDVHVHSGDGGGQHKFLNAFLPGDHNALYTRTQDALRYMHEVAGLDFGAVSEHAAHFEGYALPAAVSGDVAFSAGGACAIVSDPIVGLDDWFARHQQIVQTFDQQAAGSFVAFPAFEWHSVHTQPADTSFLHRVVLFRDFATDPGAPLPLLPGVVNRPPQCLIRFLSLAGFGPDRALAVPHMMTAVDGNIDWDLTYADSPLAPRAQVESYHRIGEIFSSRVLDQGRAYGSAMLSTFEVVDNLTGRWAYRYGWRQLGAHIGVIGSSDNHEQMPGVNDDIDLDGINYHGNEPGGYAVVLAQGKDRNAIFSALSSRLTYATSGIRALFGLAVDGAPIGAQINRSTDTLQAQISLAAGLTITRVEVWTVAVGAPPPYQLVQADMPMAETYSSMLTLTNPVAPGGAPAEWLYYVRAFFKTSGSPNDADEALWSSPVWITWSR